MPDRDELIRREEGWTVAAARDYVRARAIASRPPGAGETPPRAGHGGHVQTPASPPAQPAPAAESAAAAPVVVPSAAPEAPAPESVVVGTVVPGRRRTCARG